MTLNPSDRIVLRGTPYNIIRRYPATKAGERACGVEARAKGLQRTLWQGKWVLLEIDTLHAATAGT